MYIDYGIYYATMVSMVYAMYMLHVTTPLVITDPLQSRLIGIDVG